MVDIDTSEMDDATRSQVEMFSMMVAQLPTDGLRMLIDVLTGEWESRSDR